jgi:GNAT superfamily N-acetyltransferase
MSLPILKSNFASPQTLMRYFHKTETEWTRHIAEQTDLDFGTAWHNEQLPNTWLANRVLDAQLPDDLTPHAAFDQAAEHFTSRGLVCWQWLMNPSAPPERTGPLAEYLLAHGYRRESVDVMHMDHLPTTPVAIPDLGLTVIPARASFKHARILHEEGANRWNTPELADAAMMHLDDPHYEALLALKDSQPVGHIGVLSLGEIGLIEQVHVAESHRNQGIATVMMSRALEICARSLFKHILLGVYPTNAPAIAVYRKFGFQKIGDLVACQRNA